MAGASQSDSSLHYVVVVVFRTVHLLPTLATRFSQMRCKGTAIFWNKHPAVMGRRIRCLRRKVFP